MGFSQLITPTPAQERTLNGRYEVGIRGRRRAPDAAADGKEWEPQEKRRLVSTEESLLPCVEGNIRVEKRRRTSLHRFTTRR